MQHHRGTNRPWRRRNTKPTTDPARIFAELQRRQLNDLEDCRTAWERGSDPLAVCVAVTKCDLPEWLADALLVLLTDDDKTGGPRVFRRQWAQRHRDALDALRVSWMAMARSHPDSPQTWEKSAVVGMLGARRDGADDNVTPTAIKRAYGRVRLKLSEPGRYYAPPREFKDRLVRARTTLLGLMREDLARQREAAMEKPAVAE